MLMISKRSEAMTSEERGRRIKEARIAKKMTQSEVAGSFITRNMLSQIESGTAAPSLKTLEYLTSVLDIPASSLIIGDENAGAEAVSPDAELLINAKKMYGQGRYADALDSLKAVKQDSALYDEFAAVRARCCLRMAERLAEENPPKAADYAREAASLAEKGFYANSALKAEASKLLVEIAEKLKKYYEDIISGLT